MSSKVDIRDVYLLSALAASAESKAKYFNEEARRLKKEYDKQQLEFNTTRTVPTVR